MRLLKTILSKKQQQQLKTKKKKLKTILSKPEAVRNWEKSPRYA